MSFFPTLNPTCHPHPQPYPYPPVPSLLSATPTLRHAPLRSACPCRHSPPRPLTALLLHALAGTTEEAATTPVVKAALVTLGSPPSSSMGAGRAGGVPPLKKIVLLFNFEFI
jgi:hypothetical protein